MEDRDSLDISLAIVDGLLEHGPLGSSMPANRFRRTLMVCEPFLSLWQDTGAYMGDLSLDDVSIARGSFMSRARDESDPDSADYMLSRIDVVGPKQLRKAGVPFMSRRIVRDRAVFVDYAGHVSGRREGYEFFGQQVKSGRWMTCHAGGGRTPWNDGKVDARYQAFLGVLWESHFQWNVEFIGKSGCSFLLPVTPEGARELFKDRDKPADRERRVPLRHWVRAHSRLGQKGQKYDVRAYLRCPEPFMWRGYRCQVLPSPADRARNLENVG